MNDTSIDFGIAKLQSNLAQTQLSVDNLNLILFSLEYGYFSDVLKVICLTRSVEYDFLPILFIFRIIAFITYPSTCIDNISNILYLGL